MYNSTIVTRDEAGSVVSRFVAEVVDGVIVRSNAVQFTGYEGTAAYEAHLRRGIVGRLGIVGWDVVPGTDAFRMALCGQ